MDDSRVGNRRAVQSNALWGSVMTSENAKKCPGAMAVRLPVLTVIWTALVFACGPAGPAGAAIAAALLLVTGPYPGAVRCNLPPALPLAVP